MYYREEWWVVTRPKPPQKKDDDLTAGQWIIGIIFWVVIISGIANLFSK